MPKAKLSNVELYYEIHGDGPPLLLITGLGLDVSGWAMQMGSFAAHSRLILFDNRGAGRSGAPEPPYSTGVMARDAVDLLDALGIEQAHVLGLSMGGLIAQEMALAAPDRVASLILATSAARLAPRTRHVVDTWQRMAQRGLDTETFVREQLAWVFTDRLFADPEKVSAIVSMMLSNPFPPPPHGLAGQAAACLAHDTRNRLTQIACPTLVLVGAQDILIPVQSSEALASEIPGARLVVLDECGHGFALETPERFNGAVIDFLRDVEAQRQTDG